MSNINAVVTDYIEDNLDWETGELAKAGIDFAAHQLKFKPEEEVAGEDRRRRRHRRQHGQDDRLAARQAAEAASC